MCDASSVGGWVVIYFYKRWMPSASESAATWERARRKTKIRCCQARLVSSSNFSSRSHALPCLPAVFMAGPPILMAGRGNALCVASRDPHPLATQTAGRRNALHTAAFRRRSESIRIDLRMASSSTSRLVTNLCKTLDISVW